MEAVYVGDSANYHIFQVVDEKATGSIYLDKQEDIPDGLNLDLLTPNKDKVLWNSHIDTLLDKARDGSKQKQRLIKVKNEYSK